MNTPPTADPLCWVNREFNTEADEVCNNILNENLTTYNYTIPYPSTYFDPRPNIIMQSDGACRGGIRSSTGWQIKAVSPTLAQEQGRNAETILAKGGTLINKGLPSLVVETLALDELTSFAHHYITNAPLQLKRRKNNPPTQDTAPTHTHHTATNDTNNQSSQSPTTRSNNEPPSTNPQPPTKYYKVGHTIYHKHT